MYLELREQKCFTKTAIKDVTEPIFPPCDLKNEQITNVQAIVQLLPISLYTLPGEKSLQISNIGYQNFRLEKKLVELNSSLVLYAHTYV